jgi:hypothetical protein
MSKNERLDKEAHGHLNTMRELEREKATLKDRLAKYENVVVRVRKSIAITIEPR